MSAPIRKSVIGLILAAALTLPALAAAQVHVDGYSRRDGTYVQPHYRSAPNGSLSDNYGTQGNINSYTGQLGTRSPYEPLPTYQPQPSPWRR